MLFLIIFAVQEKKKKISIAFRHVFISLCRSGIQSNVDSCFRYHSFFCSELLFQFLRSESGFCFTASCSAVLSLSEALQTQLDGSRKRLEKLLGTEPCCCFRLARLHNFRQVRTSDTLVYYSNYTSCYVVRWKAISSMSFCEQDSILQNTGGGVSVTLGGENTLPFKINFPINEAIYYHAKTIIFPLCWLFCQIK